jgi:hypothetical protein
MLRSRGLGRLMNPRRITLTLGTAAGTAFAAALIGMANTPAARADTEPDPLEDLFGTAGTNTWTPSADASLISSDPTLAANLDATVDNYLELGTQDDPFSTLVSEVDPSAFTLSFGPDGFGGVVDDLIPLNTTGDIAAALDLAGYSVGLDTFGNPLDLPGEIFTLVFLPWLPLILGGA